MHETSSVAIIFEFTVLARQILFRKQLSLFTACWNVWHYMYWNFHPSTTLNNSCDTHQRNHIHVHPHKNEPCLVAEQICQGHLGSPVNCLQWMIENGWPNMFVGLKHFQHLSCLLEENLGGINWSKNCFLSSIFPTPFLPSTCSNLRSSRAHSESWMKYLRGDHHLYM